MSNSILNNHTKTALFQFYISDSVCRILVEKVLADSIAENNVILSDLILRFHKTFQNNADVKFNNFNCHGSDIWRIEICDELGKVLVSVDNVFYKGGIQ